ncbi:MAG: hypothetical protein IJ678_08930 [Kiritimatiellae bacterium]|nr:hypothetical protein [Kiritimatiellia bacterium]
MKSRLPRTIALLVGASLPALGCFGFFPKDVTQEGIGNFRVSFRPDERTLSIRGFLTSSSDAYTGFSTKCDGKRMLVICRSALVNKFHPSGEVDIEVDVPETVEEIFFGDWEHKIWPDQ